MKNLLSYLVLFFMTNVGFGQHLSHEVFKVGGLELSPAGYGIMETQPHVQIDSTSTEFDNYYAGMALWISGNNSQSDTFLINPEIVNNENINTFLPLSMAEDTIDERIVKALRKKINIASQIMGEELKAWI